LKVYIRFIPMAVIMGMIFYLSHQPGDFVHLPPLAGLDKFLHVIAYGTLAGTFLYGLQPFTRSSKYSVIGSVAVTFCIVYGISDEFHQSFIPGRFASFWDVLADGFGALLVVGWWLRREVKGTRYKVKG
jgi:VanZ family protein